MSVLEQLQDCFAALTFADYRRMLLELLLIISCVVSLGVNHHLVGFWAGAFVLLIFWLIFDNVEKFCNLERGWFLLLRWLLTFASLFCFCLLALLHYLILASGIDRSSSAVFSGITAMSISILCWYRIYKACTRGDAELEERKRLAREIIEHEQKRAEEEADEVE